MRNVKKEQLRLLRLKMLEESEKETLNDSEKPSSRKGGQGSG